MLGSDILASTTPTPSQAPALAPMPLKVRIPLPPRAFRAPDKWDINFILDSWIKSYRGSKPEVSDEDYYPGQQALIGALAARTRLVVACDQETPGFVLGYACGELITNPSASQGLPLAPPTPPRLALHYVYVKDDYRRQGLMRELLQALGWDGESRIPCTHWNHNARKVCDRLPLHRNEYLIYRHTGV